MIKTIVSLGLETYSRSIHEGILRYGVNAGMDVDLQQPFVEPWGPYWKDWFKNRSWQALMLLVRLTENLPPLRDSIKKIDCPAVLMCTDNVGTKWPVVLEDNRKAGQMAADYFLRLRFRHFAVVAQNLDAGYADRLLGFMEAIGDKNITIRKILLSEARRHAPKTVWRDFLRQHLREAPKPLAVFALDDMIAHSVLYHCEAEQLKIPEQVVVLGVGNDPMICDYSNPPLSSIDLNGEQLGWTAASLLHQVIDGKDIPHQPAIVPPLGIAERRSTEIVGSDNLLAMSILRYVWDHLHDSLKPADIAGSFGLTRRNLDRIFVECFGRTVKKEQNRIRMLRVKELLATADMNAKSIATETGFKTPEHMYRIFLQENKMTMKQYCIKMGIRQLAPWARPPIGATRIVE